MRAKCYYVIISTNLNIYSFKKTKGRSLQNNTPYIEEDKNDIREFFSVVKRRKKLIWSVTALLVLLALVYVFIAKPVYEVKATMELALIDKKPVQEIEDLKEKIEVVFEVNLKGKEKEFPLISSISLPKKTKNMMTIQTQGYDNNTAQQKLQEVISHIVSLQDKELDDYTDIQKKKIDLVTEDIIQHEHLSREIKKDIGTYKEKLLDISKQDAALAAIYVIEIGKKQTELNDLTSKVYDLKNQKNDYELSISPFKVQKATTIGKIEIFDDPIKPKKALIVIVAFITGLMLSIFLAFFLEFLRNIKREEQGV